MWSPVQLWVNQLSRLHTTHTGGTRPWVTLRLAYLTVSSPPYEYIICKLPHISPTKEKFYRMGNTMQVPGQAGRQCRAGGKRLFIQTGESRRGVPSLGAECESRARSGATLSNVCGCQSLLSPSAQRSLSLPSVLGTVSTYTP